MTEHDERRIEYRPLRDLKADPRNPKAHAQDAIGSSVTRFGFVEPIIVDERTGYIASGHGRVSTLTQMRMRKEPPPEGIRVSKKRGWLVPVVLWHSKNDAEAGAALIAFNRAGELGGWADEALLDLLHELEDASLDPADIGFADEEIAALAAAPKPRLKTEDTRSRVALRLEPDNATVLQRLLKTHSPDSLVAALADIFADDLT